MARKVFRPVSQEFGEREIYRDQEDFSSALVKDAPASEIPEDSLYKLNNAVAYPRYLQGRNGSRLYSSVVYPAISGRTGYTLTKSGTTVSSGSGNIFSAADVANFIVWDDGTNEEITAYISPAQVTVATSETKSGTACYVRGRVNGRLFHSIKRIILLHIGEEIYMADDILISGYTRLPCRSYDKPGDATSQFDELDDDALLTSSNGTFRIFLDYTIPYYFKVNSPIPSVSITDTEKKNLDVYGRRYLYSMSRLTGTDAIRDRTTTGAVIEAESGTNKYNPESYDYGEVWESVKRGNDTNTQGKVTGAAIAVADRDSGAVWAIINNGTFTISTVTVFVDFTGVEDMTGVADRIQLAMQAFFPDYTCEFCTDHFVITSGEVPGSTLTAITDGVGGTNIADNMACRAADGATLETAVVYEAEDLVGVLTVPVDAVTPTIPQWHWTHYSIYTDLDIGVHGTDPVTGIANNPERFMWNYDLRVAGAFFASKSTAGLVTALYGTFEEADVGSVIEWENGDRDTITSYLSATQVMVVDGGTAVDDYEEGLLLQAAAIGDGKVIRASQSGNTVTITSVFNSEIFSVADVGKAIWWPSGQVSYISAVTTGGGSCTVEDSSTRVSQGITIDPTHRNYTDRISDDILRIRRNTGLYLLKQRFFENMPNVNIGVVVPGFYFSAIRGENKMYYCQLPVTAKYLVGYYNPLYQVDENAKDGIIYLAEFPDRLVVFCKTKTYAGPTNESSEVTIPEVGEVVVVFNGLQIVDSNIGLLDYGSFQMPEHGRAIMITSEPAVRWFDGFNFGKNLAEDPKSGIGNVMKDLRSWDAATASAYSPTAGYVTWGKV